MRPAWYRSNLQRLLFHLVILGALVGGLGLAAAQSESTITIRVQDGDGAPVAGACFELTPIDPAMPISAYGVCDDNEFDADRSPGSIIVHKADVAVTVTMVQVPDSYQLIAEGDRSIETPDGGSFEAVFVVKPTGEATAPAVEGEPDQQARLDELETRIMVLERTVEGLEAALQAQSGSVGAHLPPPLEPGVDIHGRPGRFANVPAEKTFTLYCRPSFAMNNIDLWIQCG